MKKQFTMFFRSTFFLGLLLLFTSFHEANAQQKISGTVVDEAGMSVPGANVIVQGTTTGTVTDFDGNFSLNASSGDVLIVSYVGYLNQSVTVGNATSITITLKEDAAQLDEVVVIGYGTAKKSDLTGAVAQVTAKSFEDQPLVRVESALQGRASGVTVAGSGAPGKGIKIRVRGVNSMTGNNDPLVVVDGVFGGDLRTINPNNIASMEVLKDASALAIYGSRGSNGVILITTKKGSGKAKVSIDQFLTISNVNRRISSLSSSQFARQENAEFLANPVNDPADVPYSDARIAELEANPLKYQDLMFQTGYTNNTQISVSGSSDDKLRYFLSGNYMDQKGTQITSNYKRYSFRSNLSKEFNDKFSVAANVTASREITKNDQDAFGTADGSSILRAITWDPTAPVRDENGEYILRSPREVANNNYNPIRRLELSDHQVTSDRLNITLNGKYNITKNFSYTLIGSVSTINGITESMRVEGDYDLIGFNNINFRNFRSTSHQVSNILNWNKAFDKHNIDITGVYEFQGNRTINNNYNTTDQNVYGFYHTDNGTTENFDNNGSQTAIESFLARAQYNYNGIYYLTASIRQDESSRFPEDNRTGYFPSGAIAVNLAKFEFIENSPLSILKFRAGYGEVGNQSINALAAFSLNNQGGFWSPNGGGTILSGEEQTTRGNSNLTWETTKQTNIGLDFGFLNGRISGSIDFFNKDTENLLIQRLVPGSTSITEFVNAGEVNNKGVDFSLSADIIQKSDFNWNANFNLSTLKNEVTSLYEGLDFITGNVNSIGGQGIKLDVLKVGEPIGTFWGYKALGTWKSTDDIPVDSDGAPVAQPGDERFDLDPDNNNERKLQTIGSGLPTLTWGFNNTFTYKNWDLNIFLNGAHGFDVYNLVRGTLRTNGGNRSYLATDANSRWTPENETDIPKAGSANLLNTSRWVEKGDFIRLSNLKVGYTFSEDAIKGIQNLQLYASGQNVFLITDYSGYDPEVSSQVRTNNGAASNADSGAGIDIGAYPNPVSFTLGLKVTF
ncbi:SusC/RagA family TonB-linked outer membrane protein [Algibacter mikhailovii]|uniref:SusC/RagA family TonB-linked outer membrane protein n=1 Tax=Algibacter mikhailovii TaxID=425498 RepID=UPI0024955074|nr:TonB-dependent receptor [Algibacter mikhailovii]